MSTKLLTDLTVDDPVALTARYSMNAADRRKLDAQARAAQQHLADLLIRGQVGSYFRLSPSSAELVPGDVFCTASVAASEANSWQAERVVRRATASALAEAGIPLGIAITAAAPGTMFHGAIDGVCGPSITGLVVGAAGPVRVADGRCERVTTLTSADFRLGYVDAAGNLSFDRGRVVDAGESSTTQGTITAGMLITSHVTQSGLTAYGNVTPVGGVTMALDLGNNDLTKRGLWILQAGAWSRPSNVLHTPGMLVSIGAGVGVGTLWVFEPALPFTLGTSPQVWRQTDSNARDGKLVTTTTTPGQIRVVTPFRGKEWAYRITTRIKRTTDNVRNYYFHMIEGATAADGTTSSIVVTPWVAPIDAPALGYVSFPTVTGGFAHVGTADVDAIAGGASLDWMSFIEPLGHAT